MQYKAVFYIVSTEITDIFWVFVVIVYFDTTVGNANKAANTGK